MLEFPFQAKMTDGFAALLRRTAGECHRDEPDMLPSIAWCRFQSGPRAGTSNWTVHFFSRRFMNPEDVFSIGEISVHVAANERQRLKGRVLDWIKAQGLVAHQDSPNVDG